MIRITAIAVVLLLTWLGLAVSAESIAIWLAPASGAQRLAVCRIDAATVVAQSLCWEVELIGSGLLAGLLVTVMPARPVEEEGVAG